jgi:hypothetical protein
MGLKHDHTTHHTPTGQRFRNFRELYVSYAPSNENPRVGSLILSLSALQHNYLVK